MHGILDRIGFDQIQFDWVEQNPTWPNWSLHPHLIWTWIFLKSDWDICPPLKFSRIKNFFNCYMEILPNIFGPSAKPKPKYAECNWWLGLLINSQWVFLLLYELAGLTNIRQANGAKGNFHKPTLRFDIILLRWWVWLYSHLPPLPSVYIRFDR